MPPRINQGARQRLSATALIVALCVVAVVFRVAPDLGSGWNDLVKIGELGSFGVQNQGFRRWVEIPGQRPVIITLLKYYRGNHNRGWGLSVCYTGGDAVRADQRVVWGSGDFPPEVPGSEPELSSISTMECVDNRFPLPRTIPGFWYRVTPVGLEVLAHQPYNPWNRDFGHEEGYYLWSPGDSWRSSDRWGKKGPHTRYARGN